MSLAGMFRSSIKVIMLLPPNGTYTPLVRFSTLLSMMLCTLFDVVWWEGRADVRVPRETRDHEGLSAEHLSSRREPMAVPGERSWQSKPPDIPVQTC